MKDIIYEVSLTGIYQFWVSCNNSGVDLDMIVSKYEAERGKYGFTYIKKNKQYLVIKDFIAKNPVLTLRYRTWIDLELHKRMRSIKWLTLVLLEFGHQVNYQTVARWVEGRSVPKIGLQNILKQVFLRY